ncbi:MAG: transglycosylase SLT domain-containing protein [Thermoanaerobaculia bacterium]|jgi:soluble lytic murein transglycosylase-like protein|nr:transglycosylase SLT domain-containing protein [Thermoanaerobaculia bacterium]MBP9825488.1 transglycosylase SLT domain-containing protein [Thermoanaerobaculia bacterium]
MILRLASMLLAATIDPRIGLVELQGAGENERALEEAKCLADAEPGRARAIGLDFLRGHLLERLGRLSEGTEAFALAIGATPDLAPWARYRLAAVQEQLGHPEVAAGISATLLAQGAPKRLIPPAATLLFRTVRRGGDCRLLRGVPIATLPPGTARDFRLVVAECHLRHDRTAEARQELEHLLASGASDLAAFRAAELWLALWPQPADRELARALGTALARQRDFTAAIPLLERALVGSTDSGSGRDAETLYLLARAEFWSGRYPEAARHFDRLAAAAKSPTMRADARYQQARSLELVGDWPRALVLFDQAYTAEPLGEWSGAALLASFRLRWLSGDEAGAARLLDHLATQRSWRPSLARGAIFAAVSEIVRGDSSERPAHRLRTAERTGAAAGEELAYWRGRLAELRSDPEAAVGHYLEVLRERPFHPLATAARGRLERPELAPAAERIGRRRSAGRSLEDAWAAWTLLGESDSAGLLARQRGSALLRAQPALALWIDWQPVPVASWPIWTAVLLQPEERLLALGLWSEGSPAQARHFPSQQRQLAFTLAHQLDAAGASDRAIEVAERLFQGRPQPLPAEWVAVDLRRLLYPLPYRAELGKRVGSNPVDLFLLAAVMREESRFQTEAVSPAAARGLAQLVLPTARRLARKLGWGEVRAEELHQPAISIALGAAYLAELKLRFGEGPSAAAAAPMSPLTIAAYNAGEDQATLWRRYCQTAEPEEYLAKVGFRETRSYLVRVLESQAQYAALYADPVAGRPNRAGPAR